MPENTLNLSQREDERIRGYAARQGITEEEALGQLAIEQIRARLRARHKCGEVKAFKLLKSD
jgi:hypothetical protein